MIKYGAFSIVIFLSMLTVSAQQQKFSVAVLNLKNGANVSKGETDIISDRIRIELFKTGNVDVMEREQMQNILKEQGFQSSGACSDEGCMVEMGQVLGVQRVITGSMGKLGELYLLNMRMIDVQTAKILKVVSEDIDGDIEKVVEYLERLAWNLTSSEQRPKPIVQKSEPEGKEPEEKPQQPEKNDTTIPQCKDRVFLEAADFTSILPFKILDDTYNEINSDIQDAMEEILQDEFSDDLEVEVLNRSQVAGLPSDCRSPVIRTSLETYSTKQSGTQFVGKVKVAFYFYTTPSSDKALFKITIEEEGARHWGDQVPLMNAFESVAEEIEDKLEDAELLKKLIPRK